MDRTVGALRTKIKCPLQRIFLSFPASAKDRVPQKLVAIVPGVCLISQLCGAAPAFSKCENSMNKKN